MSATAPRAAYCDVDGTLTRTTIVTPLAWMRRRLQSAPAFVLWQASLLLRGPWWLLLDRVDRHASNRAIYSHYAGLDTARARSLAEQCWRECLRPRLFPQALAQMEKWRRDGVRLVLVTGGLDLFMEPMAREFGAECIAPSLEERGGIFTGALTGPPLAGEAKADAVRAHAARHGVDLRESWALGDAPGDLPMLALAGRPVVVNPGGQLARVAAQRGWTVERWRP